VAARKGAKRIVGRFDRSQSRCRLVEKLQLGASLRQTDDRDQYCDLDHIP